mmetsp:Transcript_5060/g.10991  ORF Transcript_5060/g.10991 Transcript_5060/m.10991 type:complete len:373 (-) Transcript_5060:205-1323(-)
MKLVGLRHVLVEHLQCHLDQVGVRHPGAIMTRHHLALLVGANLCECRLVGCWVVLDGDLSRHAAHGVNTPLVAGLDEQLDVRVHEGGGHAHVGAVGQHKLGVVPELLDEAENVVPAPAVQACRVVPQLVYDFVHLEAGQDGLNQHGGPDGAARQAQHVLSHVEDVVPQPCLQVALHLGQVEVGAPACRDEGLHVVEEEEGKVEYGGAAGLAVNQEVLLLQVPAAGPDNEGGGLAVLAQCVVLAGACVTDRDSSPHRLLHVDLALEVAGPGGCVGVLKVSHVLGGSTVESVDHHLLGGNRTCDLDTAILHVRRRSSGHPDTIANVFGFGQKVRKFASVDLLLAHLPPFQQLFSSGAETPLKHRNECLRILSED